MGRIITLSGPSGSGKTVIYRKLKELYNGRAFIIESITTRAPRADDVPGEYRFVTEEQFRAFDERHEFLWRVPPREVAESGKDWYGTLRESVASVLMRRPNEIGFMILTPESIAQLHAAFPAYSNSIQSFYILPASEEEMKRRLQEDRGWSDEQIATRVEREEKWLQVAHSSNAHFRFIRNDGHLECAIWEIARHIT